MRKKGLLATILAASLLLSGCSLALPEEDGKTDGDPMVGVLVTTQPLDLFDSEAYLRENARKRAMKAATIPECRMTMCSATARAPFM